MEKKMINSFIGIDRITKASFVGVALWFCSFYVIFFVWIFFILLLVFLFRKKKLDLNSKRTLEPNMFYSPVSGTVSKVRLSSEKIQVVIRSRVFNNYGVYLPINGLVESKNIENDEINTVLIVESQKIFLKQTPLFKLFKGIIYVSSGDRGMLGANIGYLPFGGKTVIELPKRSEVLVREGDKVESFQTLLSNIPLEIKI
jgi:hypothetical protein